MSDSSCGHLHDADDFVKLLRAFPKLLAQISLHGHGCFSKLDVVVHRGQHVRANDDADSGHHGEDGGDDQGASSDSAAEVSSFQSVGAHGGEGVVGSCPHYISQVDVLVLYDVMAILKLGNPKQAFICKLELLIIVVLGVETTPKSAI